MKRVAEALAGRGRKVPTAGSGSYWVYDAVHHVAASSEFGDVNGDTVMYAPPPAALPARDLSAVVSARGLHLGSRSADAARALGVSPAAVKRISPHQTVLYARADRTCGTYRCAHDAIVVFRDDRAVAVQLADIAP